VDLERLAGCSAEPQPAAVHHDAGEPRADHPDQQADQRVQQAAQIRPERVVQLLAEQCARSLAALGDRAALPELRPS